MSLNSRIHLRDIANVVRITCKLETNELMHSLEKLRNNFRITEILEFD